MTQQHVNNIKTAISELNNKLNVLNRLQLKGTSDYDEILSDLIALESCLLDMSAFI